METRAPLRPTYLNVYRWPESDVEFVKTVAEKGTGSNGSICSSGRRREYQRVVDSYSCRQMYLRSYTFSRKETVPEKTRKFVGKLKMKAFRSRRSGGGSSGSLSCDSLVSVFLRVLSCTTKLDVVDPSK
ncbi:uncharacterized protein LOC116256771 [Nymphaea colorata]|uniref:Uncharacterized protein n=1 Tax=Nymphaea colorata TaxID=210225 RepID=A0A5K1DVI5_9MAGN|nr:uncharacterized protein LOC116256771 [Nymphaea colorata]